MCRSFVVGDPQAIPSVPSADAESSTYKDPDYTDRMNDEAGLNSIEFVEDACGLYADA